MDAEAPWLEGACLGAACVSHALLWARAAARRRGSARAALVLSLIAHSHAWSLALREGRPVAGYRALCARRVAWTGFRITREALSSEETWRSPQFWAFGQQWAMRTCLNRSVGGASYVSAHLAREPQPQGALAPPAMEMWLQLGDASSRPESLLPQSASLHRLLSHRAALLMLRRRPHLTLGARILRVGSCVRRTQLALALAEAALLAWLDRRSRGPQAPRPARVARKND